MRGGNKMKKTKWYIGDDTSMDQLIDHIGALLRVRRLTLQQIADLTGASKQRISASIVRLQLYVPVKNGGTRTRAIWFIPRE
jgi:DNA-binding transcriptional regulator GbsR (MarR family)